MNEENQDHIEEEAAAETKQQEQDRLEQIEAYEDTLEYYRHIQS